MTNENNKIPAYEDAVPFEPSEFVIIYNLLSRSSKGLSARRRQIVAKIAGGDSAAAAGRARGAILSDAFAPIRERYRGEPVRYHSAVHRLIALAKLIKSPRLKRWVKLTVEGVALDEAVLAAAATVRLTAEGEFPPDDFMQAVESFSGGTS